MAHQHEALTERLIEFIADQKIYFVGTATADSRVNVSPKGMDSFRILNTNRAVWLNVTGSGNETSAHVQQNPRMTIMFCAFDGAPLTLRLYGTARVVHRNDEDWAQLLAHFGPLPGARQIFDLSIDLVQTSCGMAVPYYAYTGEREQLSDWARKQGDDGLKKYWGAKNQTSIDGVPTNILAKNL
ncbi:MAG: pyridoxamine 5'-phosphate oxidase family protein [Methylocystis sp.]|nr:pyridoxamine 5'-phosphate oxidase family protein [Methylocystis sp.]